MLPLLELQDETITDIAEYKEPPKIYYTYITTILYMILFHDFKLIKFMFYHLIKPHIQQKTYYIINHKTASITAY